MSETELTQGEGSRIRLLAPVEQLIDRLNVRAVFGAPVGVEGGTVIPAAEVHVGFGYVAEAPPARPGRVGALGQAAPRGYIQATEQGIRYRPAVDPTRITLAGLVTWGWTIYWITYMVRALVRREARR